MSNYSITVGWSGKDALADSDAGKVISGDDFHTEFSAVQTAVNSKANLAGDATQAFSATTAAAGTNTTQVATTAFVQTASVAYPVGAIFTTTVAYANSAAVVTAIGGTTWAAFGAGKVLLGLDSGDTDFDTAEETGGAKTIGAGTSGSTTLTTSQIPAHSHEVGGGEYSGSYDNGTNFSNNNLGSTTGSRNHKADTSSAGGGGGHTHTTPAHSLVQPYIVVYFWKRTA